MIHLHQMFQGAPSRPAPLALTLGERISVQGVIMSSLILASLAGIVVFLLAYVSPFKLLISR